jgi:hypothetical protein
MSDYEVTLINDNSQFPRVQASEKRRQLPHSRMPADSVQCRWKKGPGSVAASSLTGYLYRQEFYVAFKGPTESKIPILHFTTHNFKNGHQRYREGTLPKDTHADSGLSVSAFRRWSMESPRRAPRCIPVQITLNRLRQQDLSSEY